jgi:hypothetical protein
MQHWINIVFIEHTAVDWGCCPTVQTAMMMTVVRIGRVTRATHLHVICSFAFSPILLRESVKQRNIEFHGRSVKDQLVGKNLWKK